MRVFKSNVDLWLAGVLLMSALICLAVCVSVVLQGNLFATLLVMALTLPGVVLPLWILLSTEYVINDDLLLVKSGPFAWKVAIASITALTATHNPLSSPALSLDRLRVDYGKGQSLMISPKNREDFLHALGKTLSQ